MKYNVWIYEEDEFTKHADDSLIILHNVEEDDAKTIARITCKYGFTIAFYPILQKTSSDDSLPQ